MSNNKTNESLDSIENDKLKDLIIEYINEIKNEETRSKAIENLYKYREKYNDLAVYLWFSRGTIAALLQ